MLLSGAYWAFAFWFYSRLSPHMPQIAAHAIHSLIPPLGFAILAILAILVTIGWVWATRRGDGQPPSGEPIENPEPGGT